MKARISGLILSCLGVLLLNCGKNANEHQPTFTKADSLTDLYLSLQDSMLQSWNIMINDDNQKIKAMHHLLHELMAQTTGQSDELNIFEKQLDHLVQLRYDQRSIAYEDLIEQYDFASNSLVTELISLAETKTEFPYNTTLQKLVDDIRIADQRVTHFRKNYDRITREYNDFLTRNKNYLREISLTDSLEKPLFQIIDLE